MLRSAYPHWWMFQSLFWWKYCPGTVLGRTMGAHLIRFQSLFWWKYCPGPIRAIDITSGGLSVSILVLVEVLPWVYVVVFPVVLQVGEFQSLFWWKYCPGGKYRWTIFRHSDGFQSLFWWKYCPGTPQSRVGEWQLSEVSILVLVEVLPWEMGVTPNQSYLVKVSILVLVEVLPWEKAVIRIGCNQPG